jgi:hypothetical protein
MTIKTIICLQAKPGKRDEMGVAGYDIGCPRSIDGDPGSTVQSHKHQADSLID